ncbi:MAG: phage antirepressor KilAC domain-containing protein [Ruminococcus sp.]|nr:phage antirepressor KilAC domain-containing protein [Ruminococcus sp.]
MNEIMIVVNYDSDKPTVSGRELHAALMIETPYHKWFPRMVGYGFTEEIDYWTFLSNRSDGLAGKPRTDHQLTIDMAKELCMIQRSEIGKRCREYFLEIEKKWNSPEAVLARALLLANQQLQLAKGENTKLLATNSEQAEQIESMQPKVTYYELVLNAEGIVPITTIAKDYGKSGRWLNGWLHEQGVQYKQGEVWLLYQKYADKGYVKSKTYTVTDENGNPLAKPHTCWTQKGRLMIYELLKEHGILPLVEQDSGDT